MPPLLPKTLIEAISPITKHSTMLNKNPPRYVNNMAREIAHGAFNSGNEISSAMWEKQEAKIKKHVEHVEPVSKSRYGEIEMEETVAITNDIRSRTRIGNRTARRSQLVSNRWWSRHR
ncbi:MAG: hypothetical protein L6R40_005901 [Gallowayella cf. fulva]|nr:MAG: hypothetical protein L6R40_005901 [Xanthomendoza cf. fulva]